MDISKWNKGTVISTNQEYLHWLGKYLLFFFPTNQVLEILKDYQEYISAGKEKESVEDTVKQWGTPGQVVRAMLEENPQAKRYCYQWSAFWGVAMILSFVFSYSVSQDIDWGLILMPVCVFGFLHGRGQLAVEHHLFIKAGSAKKIFAVYFFLTVTVIFLEAEIQWLVENVERMPTHVGGISIGLAIDREYAFFQVILLLLILWMVKKAVTVSIRYLPDTAYPLGVMLFIASVRNCLHSLNILTTNEVRREFLFPVIYCAGGMGIAVIWKWLAGRMGRCGLWMRR